MFSEQDIDNAIKSNIPSQVEELHLSDDDMGFVSLYADISRLFDYVCKHTVEYGILDDEFELYQLWGIACDAVVIIDNNSPVYPVDKAIREAIESTRNCQDDDVDDSELIEF